MRILLLSDRIPPENRGGAGEIAWRLAVGLRSAGHEIQVVAATPHTSFTDMRDGIPTTHLHSRYPERWRGYLSLYNPQTLPELRRIYREFQPDVINAHNIHYDLSYYSLTLAHNMGIPAVFSSHDVMPFAYHKLTHFIDPTVCGVRQSSDYRLPPFYNLKQMRFRYNPLRNMIIRRVLTRHAVIRTAPSHELVRALEANGLPQFDVVHNGIDPELMPYNPVDVQALRQRLNLTDKRVILFAGRLTHAKGTVQLLDALRQVIKRVPDVRLLVLSPVPIADQIDAKTYAELADHIVSGGWMQGSELASAYHLADVVTVPSIIFDTFPTVMLEAMVTRTPVIVSCYGGAKEAVTDGQTGRVINPFDTDQFTSALIRILTDDSYAQKLGQAGYEHVTGTLTLSLMVQRMSALFEEARRLSARAR